MIFYLNFMFVYKVFFSPSACYICEELQVLSLSLYSAASMQEFVGSLESKTGYASGPTLHLELLDIFIVEKN